MKRFALLALLISASASHAASLGVVSDKVTYFIGETITLTVVGDDAGSTAYGVFGRLDYTGALVDNGTRSQITLEGQYGKWIRGVLYAEDDGIDAYSTAFNQIAGLYAQTADNLFGQPLSVVTLIAVDAGVVDVSWHTASDGWQLDFFGLTNAPGTSFTVLDCDGDPGCTPPVPEPATGPLLALGLLALTARRLIRARGTIETR